ncbi:MAG: tetratricopeptide repeat protein [Chitinophagaceae bacterium]|nr:MAG: tetratricopeptide repeat protein [Chitinophagaceae bacterium]
MHKVLLSFLLMLWLGAGAQEKEALRKRLAVSADYRTKLELYYDFLGKSVTRDFDEVVEVGGEALELARSRKDSLAVGALQRYIGEAYYFKGDYATAATFLYSSIQKLEAGPAGAALGNSYNALAKLYRKTRDLERASANYDKALALFRQLKDEKGESMILNESGVVFEYAGDYETAAARYNASLELDERRKDTIGMSYALSNLAGVYVLQKRFDEARNYQQQALELRKVLRDSFALALSYSDMGELYLAMGRREQARAVVDSSSSIAAEMGYSELLSNNYDLLARISESRGDYRSALEAYRRRSLLHDSLFSVERSKKIEELSARYESLKREQTIRDQRYQLEHKNLLLTASGGLLLLGAALGWNFYRRRQFAAEAKLQTVILQQQELATKAILEAEEGERQRIAKDLHDGVGQMMSAARMNLSALAHRLQLRNPEQSADYERIVALVDESCREVRIVSHNMMPNALLKNSLAAAIREFIDKIDHKALQVHLYTEGLDERLDGNIETVLYRVIQECVNNVIKHSGAHTLDIAIVRDDNELTATVEDNGRGFDTATVADGIGLRNIRTRVEYLKGAVEFDSKPGRGTVVSIHIPLQRTLKPAHT